MKTLVYASHLDSPLKIPLVEYNLQRLKTFFDKIILVYSSIDKENIFLPSGFCGLNQNQIFLIPNKGYDFGKYKFGLEKSISNSTSHAVIINDSVSVIQHPGQIFQKIDQLITEGFQNIGILSSNEIKTHYQSWCWILEKKAQDFCIKNINTKLQDKQEVIINNEVDISNQMILNFKSCSLFDSDTNIFYRDANLILKYIESGFPFIKNNAFDDSFLVKEELQFNQALTNPKYIDKTLLNLIVDYYEDKKKKLNIFT